MSARHSSGGFYQQAGQTNAALFISRGIIFAARCAWVSIITIHYAESHINMHFPPGRVPLGGSNRRRLDESPEIAGLTDVSRLARHAEQIADPSDAAGPTDATAAVAPEATTVLIPLSRPHILESDIDLVNEVIRSGQLVQGTYVRKLEDQVNEQVGVAHSKAVSSGTAALHLALIAAGVQPGDEVIVPAFSFVATANVVELVGATPVFVDIDSRTFNLDAAQIESAITLRTRAIMPVHEFGLMCDIEAILDIAATYKLAVIEDAACAIGATSNGQQAGSFGDIACFSLHPRKLVTSGEGGLVVTNSAEAAMRVDRLRNHGIEDVNGEKVFAEVGYNYRLSDFQAALVYSQVQRLSDNLDHRTQLAAAYHTMIENPLVEKPVVPDGRTHSWQTYHVLLDARVDRNDLIEYLRSFGIQSGLGAQCIPDQQFYRDKYSLDAKRLYPRAMRAYQQGLALPMAETMTYEQAAFVAERINDYRI